MAHWKRVNGKMINVSEGRMPEGGIGPHGKASLMNKSKTLSKIRALKAKMASASDEEKKKMQAQMDFLNGQLKKAK